MNKSTYSGCVLGTPNKPYTNLELELMQQIEQLQQEIQDLKVQLSWANGDPRDH